jgi:nitrite reductase/ring-hydroxylating ferredoxin subunit
MAANHQGGQPAPAACTQLGRRRLLLLGGAIVMQPACGGIASAVSGRDAGPEPGDGAGPQPEAGAGSDGNLGSDVSTGLDGSTGFDGGAPADTGVAVDTSTTDASRSTEGGPGCATGVNTFTLTFAQYPPLLKVGGSANVQATGYADPTCGENYVFVFQKSPGTYVALSSSCTHACCVLAYSGTELRCPCDGATFDLTGATTSGKTSVNLSALAVCADANGVTVSW